MLKGSDSGHRRPAGAAPISLVAPAITGTPQVGSLLSVSTGTWSETPFAFSYQWEHTVQPAGDVWLPITSATGSVYTPVSNDFGLRCQVTAHNRAGTGGATSNTVTVQATPSSLGAALPSRMPESSGATFYVDASTGSDSRTATQAQNISTPWLTINKALSTVPAGSIVRVLAGSYTSSGSSYCIVFSRVIPASNPITLIAHTGQDTVFIRNASVSSGAPIPTHSGNTIGAWIHDASGLRIQEINFAVRGSTGNLGTVNGYANTYLGAEGALVDADSTDIEFYRCVFKDGGGVGIRSNGTSGNPVRRLHVYNCYFEHMALDAGGYYGVRGTHFMYEGAGPGQTLGGSEVTVVANCVFVGDMPGHHIQSGSQARNFIITNNTFYNNTPSYDFNGYCVCPWNSGDALGSRTNGGKIYNNVMLTAHHAVYGSGSTMADNHVGRNVAFGMSHSYFDPVYGGSILFVDDGDNVIADPLLVDPANGDFTLQATSPAIEFGHADYTPTFDYLENTRVTADAGAYAKES